MAVTVSMYVIRPEILFRGVWHERHHLELTRVPSVGEFIDPYSMENRPDDDWYKVVMVVHSPSEANCVANIFVKPVDYHEAFPSDEEDEARVEAELRAIESSSNLRKQLESK